MKSNSVPRGYQWLRAPTFLYVLALPMLLLCRVSFAFFPAPLSPAYLLQCNDAHGTCAAGIGVGHYTIGNSPGTTANGYRSALIGYMYTTQVAGTVPIYLVQCSVHCTAANDGISITNALPAPTSGLVGTLIGYVFASQVAATVPTYLLQCGSRGACITTVGAGNYTIGSAPGTTASGFSSGLIGYDYAAIPAPTTYTLSPSYFIGSVIYIPPGQGPSSIAYGSGSVTGTTVSTTQSWTNSSTAGLSGGIGSITFGDSFSGSTSTSTDMQNTATQTTTYKGPATNSINHDYDQIVLFLGVKVNASVDYLGNTTWGVDFSQVAALGFAETGYPISVGCLRANSTIAAAQCTATLNFLSSAGITSSDYPQILGADPFANPAASQTPAAGRFVLIDSVNFLPDPTTSTVAYTLNNSSTITNSSTVGYSYSVNAGISIAALKAGNTMTWTNSSTQSNRTGSSSSSTFTLSLPSSPYSGPSTLFVYIDTIYKTFLFSFD